MALEAVQFLADLRGGNGILGPILYGGIAGEVAAAFTRIAHGTALAEESKDHQIVAFGSAGNPFDGLENVLARRRFAMTGFVRITQKQANVLGIRAEVILVGEN